MRLRRLVFISAAIVIAAVTYLATHNGKAPNSPDAESPAPDEAFTYRPDRKQEDNSVSVAATERSTVSGLRAQGTSTDLPSKGNLPSVLSGASKYSQALGNAIDRNRLEADVLADRLLLAKGCGAELLALIGARAAHQPTESNRAEAAYFQAFCDRPPEDIKALEKELSSMANSDVVQAQDLLPLSAEDPQLALQQASRLLQESRSHAAIDAIHGLLSANDSLSLNLKGLAGELPQRADTRRIELLAIQIISCDISRACGSNSFLAWQQCAGAGLCKPGIDMQMIWRATYSPLEFEIATKIANQIRQYRM